MSLPEGPFQARPLAAITIPLGPRAVPFGASTKVPEMLIFKNKSWYPGGFFLEQTSSEASSLGPAGHTLVFSVLVAGVSSMQDLHLHSHPRAQVTSANRGHWPGTLCPCVPFASPAFQAAGRSRAQGGTDHAGQLVAVEGHGMALQQPERRPLWRGLARSWSWLSRRGLLQWPCSSAPGALQLAIFWASRIQRPQMLITPALQCWRPSCQVSLARPS